jgi:hypothetical protein
MRSGILTVVYYFEHADTLRPIASAVLAVILWPLLLLGINLHIK